MLFPRCEEFSGMYAVSMVINQRPEPSRSFQSVATCLPQATGEYLFLDGIKDVKEDLINRCTKGPSWVLIDVIYDITNNMAAT
jgi:hypothetical protein